MSSDSNKNITITRHLLDIKMSKKSFIFKYVTYNLPSVMCDHRSDNFKYKYNS